MLHKTRGIVLHSLGYNDTYSITLIYTEKFGRVSYLTTQSKSRKTKTPKSLFHALAVLDLEVDHQNLREIQRIKEARTHISLFSLLNDPVKSAVSIFLAELMSKVIKEIQPNKALFEYFLQSIQILELTEESSANFHLVFMIGLSRFLGSYPDATGYKKGMFFDMQNGVFVSYKPTHPHFLNPDESLVFSNLLRMNYENMSTFRFSRIERKAIINRMLEYYRLHLANFPEIKSLEILHEVFE
ncbi:DNA repair protein RecO [Bacteroidia bacterium]|nr:DNA repair protein RecO [Bacteroidia bacterium]GHV70534.1 DNA repair protein RecO [Bacteroidia bacterium]